MIGTTLQIVGESLCEAVDVQAGKRVLDVAAGNGASLAAARRGADVPAGVRPAVKWGNEAHLGELFGPFHRRGPLQALDLRTSDE